ILNSAYRTVVIRPPDRIREWPKHQSLFYLRACVSSQLRVGVKLAQCKTVPKLAPFRLILSPTGRGGTDLIFTAWRKVVANRSPLASRHLLARAGMFRPMITSTRIIPLTRRSGTAARAAACRQAFAVYPQQVAVTPGMTVRVTSALTQIRRLKPSSTAWDWPFKRHTPRQATSSITTTRWPTFRATER